jgi:hypothetical protein
MERWKTRARALKREVHAPLLACRDLRVSWQVKLAAVLVVSCGAKPIGRIPGSTPACTGYKYLWTIQ